MKAVDLVEKNCVRVTKFWKIRLWLVFMDVRGNDDTDDRIYANDSEEREWENMRE
jgi:hypothetical protein